MNATIEAPQATTPHVAEPFRVVYATPTKTGTQLKFRCPCGRDHLHGRAEPGDGTTPYRESHCHEPGSPLYQTVYLLVEVEPNDPRLFPAPRGRRPRKER